jgi:hypothetical protein
VGRRLALMLASALALAFFAVGCGGSDDSTGGGETALTKAEFIAKGDAICKRSSEEILKGYKKFTKEHGITELPGRKQSYELTEQVYLPSVEKRLEALRALTPPEGEEAKIEAILAPAEAGVETGKENVAPLFKGKETPFDKSNKLATQYGFKVCGTI